MQILGTYKILRFDEANFKQMCVLPPPLSPLSLFSCLLSLVFFLFLFRSLKPKQSH